MFSELNFYIFNTPNKLTTPMKTGRARKISARSDRICEDLSTHVCEKKIPRKY